MAQSPSIEERDSEFPWPTLLRFIGYTSLITIFTTSLPLLVRDGQAEVFRENGLLEWGEFSLLISASTLFFIAARVLRAFRELFLALGSFSGFAAIRELDGLLDAWRFLGGWKFGFGLILYASCLIYKQKARFARQLAEFLSTSAFAVLWSGFIVAIPVAQLVGHGPFLQALMREHYQWGFKHAIEECGEFVGYLMLWVGSIESLLQMKRLQIRLADCDQ